MPSLTTLKAAAKKASGTIKAGLAGVVSKKGTVAGKGILSGMDFTGISPIGNDVLQPSMTSKIPKPKALKRPTTAKAGTISPVPGLQVVDMSPGAVGGPALGTIVQTREGPTFYDAGEGPTSWGTFLDEGIGGAGAVSAGADSAGSAAETAAGDSAASDGSLPNATYSDDLSLTGPLAQLWDELKNGAAELGITLEEYADRIISEYPAVALALGVTTGAGLIALLYSMASGSGAGASTGTTKKASTGTRKKKVTAKKNKPKDWSVAEWAAWNKSRGSSGPISAKDFHEKVWPEMHKTHHHKAKPKKEKKKSVRTKGGDTITYTPAKKKGKKKGKKKASKKGKHRVSFTTADGQRVSFMAKE